MRAFLKSLSSTKVQQEKAKNIGSASIALTNDEEDLKAMGYKQDLFRGFSGLMNFSFCFTAVGIIPSISGTFLTGLSTGGPVVMVWSWIIVGILSICVTLNLAEICSAYPSAGSVYHWAGSLAGKHGAVFSFFTGWINFVGNSAGDAFWGLTFAQTLNTLIMLQNGGNSMDINSITSIGLAVCVVWALINLTRVDFQGHLNNVGMFFQMAITIVIIISLAIATPALVSTAETSNLLSGSFANATIVPGTTNQVFFTYFNGSGFDDSNAGGVVYVTLIGLIFVCYSFTGYEAAGHVAEETTAARKSAPWGIALTGIVSFFVGFAYLLSLLYVTAGDVSDFVGNGLGVADIFSAALGTTGGLALGYLLLIQMFFTGISSFTVTTRVGFAMARDGCFPGSTYLYNTHPTTKAPIGAIILVLILDIFFISLNFGSSSAFIAITSISVIGYQVSYAIPILLRSTYGKKDFPETVWNLGGFGDKLGLVSAFFMIFTSVLFLFPTVFPVTSVNMNYTVVVFGGFMLIATIYWFAYARKVFKGPPKPVKLPLVHIETFPLTATA